MVLYLEPALDEIERRDGGVSDSARQDAAQAAQRVVLGRPELARVLLRGRRRQRATARCCCDGGSGVRVLERAREEVAAARFAHAEHVHLGGGVVSGGKWKGVHVVLEAYYVSLCQSKLKRTKMADCAQVQNFYRSPREKATSRK